jgi:hypothetical protein
MLRHVLQVKRMNSTNCNPPDARLTVVGSVAWSSGPREVATGTAVAASVGAVWFPDSSVGAARVNVAGASVGNSVTPAGGFVVVDSAAQAANRITIKLMLRRDRFVFMFLMNRYSIKSLRKAYNPSYESPASPIENFTSNLRFDCARGATGVTLSAQRGCVFDVREILRYTVFSSLVT